MYTLSNAKQYTDSPNSDEEALGMSAADRISKILRDRIIEGYIDPGTRLTESSLTKDVGAARNTVREALRQLRVEGLVEHVRNKGFFVRYFTPIEVLDIFKMRRALEIRALQQSSLADPSELNDSLAAIEDAEQAMRDDNWRRVGSSSLRFHQAIVALLNCRMLDEVFQSGMAQMRLLFALMADEKAFQKPWIPRDRAIWEALMAGQRDAAVNALHVYLDDSERAVVDVVRSLKVTA